MQGVGENWGCEYWSCEMEDRRKRVKKIKRVPQTVTCSMIIYLLLDGIRALGKGLLGDLLGPQAFLESLLGKVDFKRAKRVVGNDAAIWPGKHHAIPPYISRWTIFTTLHWEKDEIGSLADERKHEVKSRKSSHLELSVGAHTGEAKSARSQGLHDGDWNGYAKEMARKTLNFF